jgi:GntR family transcriptional regulator
VRFDIAPQDTLPIYRQIVDQVRRQVAGGQLRAGDELPSVRALAAEHAINPMTVSKAYALLEAEGLLERRRGLGMVVAQQRTPTARLAERLALLEPGLAAVARQAAQLKLPTERVLALLAQCLAQQIKESNDDHR